MNVDHILTIGFDELTAAQQKRLERQLTFQKDNGDILIAYRKQMLRGYYEVPRGAWYLLPDSIVYRDNRSCPKMPRLNFTVVLDDIERDPRFEGQSSCVLKMREEEQGMIVRPPGTGKTQIAMAFAALCQTRTLVIVHTEDILNQWVDYIEAAIPELQGKVGIIRGRKCEIGHITVATVQTLHKYVKQPDKWWRQWGCLIADEAHHVAAPTWEAVINRCPARYRFGFTASPTRADGMDVALHFIIGPIIHRQKFSSPVKLKVVPVKTNFKCVYRGAFDWSHLLDELVSDDERNLQIADTIGTEFARGNTVLVLSRRIEHLRSIAELVECPVEILTGQRSRADRKRILSDFRSGKLRVLLATQLADEALDVPRLNRVCLIHPGKHEGRIIQQVGRAIRKHPDKQDAIIYDFVDDRMTVLRNQWRQRKRTYNKEKISVQKIGLRLRRAA